MKLILPAALRELRWRCRLSDAQYLRVSEWRCRWFPYRLAEFNGRGKPLGPTRWQWPDIFRKPIR